MATTRIIPLHVNKGKTIAQCLTDRTDYAKNPDKTDGGEYVTAYECDPKTVDAEFLFSKRQYKTITGRSQKNDVIAYQIRQSFKPGEITPEEANRIGYEFALRFTKGEHAFLVATHTDKHHIHNHVIWNSTSLDCSHKYRDFLHSARAVARLSDTICIEHGKSVVDAPKRHSKSYDKWLGNRAKPSNREVLRAVIDNALNQKPADLDALLLLLQQAGYTVKRGKHITLQGKNDKKPMRLDSLGDSYSQADLTAILAGEKKHRPHKKRVPSVPPKVSLLIDIDAKLRAGKGRGYQRWASVFNAKQTAETINFLKAHSDLDYAALSQKTEAASVRFHSLTDQIKAAETRMAEIVVLKTQIINYAKTREVFAAYKKSGYSKKYLAAHESDIILHRAAKKAFQELGLEKLPTVKSLQTEYAKLLAEKKAAYADYHTARDEMRELLTVKANIDRILGEDTRLGEKKKEQERS